MKPVPTRSTRLAVCILLLQLMLSGCGWRFGKADLPASLKQPYSIEVFFATDRALDEAGRIQCGGRHIPFLDFRGRPDPGRTVRYGSETVTVPAGHRIGRFLKSASRKPSCADAQRHNPIPVPKLFTDEDEFFRATRPDPASGNGDVLVLVHGYSFRFDEATRVAAQLKHDLGFHGTMLVFSWPSHGSVRRYEEDEAELRASIPGLERFLRQTAQRFPGRRIHLLGHSLGAWALMTAVDGIAQEQPSGTEGAVRFGQVIYFAPDANMPAFEKMAERAARLATRMTVYVSSKDRLLIGSGRRHKDLRAGDSGVKVMLIRGVDTIEVSAIDPTWNGHTYYRENRVVLADMHRLLSDGAPPEKRFGTLQAPADPGGRVFWALRP